MGGTPLWSGLGTGRQSCAPTWLFPGSWVEQMLWTEAGGMSSLVCLSFLVLWWNWVRALSELKESLAIFCEDYNNSNKIVITVIIINSLIILGEPWVQKACQKLWPLEMTTCSTTEMARGSRSAFELTCPLSFSVFYCSAAAGQRNICGASDGLESKSKELFLAWTLVFASLPSFPKLRLSNIPWRIHHITFTQQASLLTASAKLKQLT